MKHLALLSATALLVAGCASPVVMKYEPTVSAQPVQDGLPRIYLAAADDAAGGFRFDGPAYVAPTGPLTDLFRQALVTEFRRIGLPLASDPTQAGALLYATLTEASVKWNGGMSVPVDGAVRLKLAFKDRHHRPLWNGNVVGGGQVIAFGGGAGIGAAPGRAANAAFADAIGKIGPLFENEELTRALMSQARTVASDRPAERIEASVPTSDLDELPASRTARPKSYAVVIGVEHYREKLPNADFAAADAKLTAQYFERVLGVPEANVAVLTDERAGKADFEKYFESWLPNHVEADDTVYVYYSGHGAPNPAKGDAYLVPYDADPTYIEKTGYPVKRLLDQLAKLPAKQVYVAMDSCFSGAGGRSVIAQGARPLVSLVQDEVPAKMVVLSASAGDQISNSYRDKGHGLFTYYLLKGLREKDGDMRAAFDYLKPEVARLARTEYNSEQQPQWREGR